MGSKKEKKKKLKLESTLHPVLQELSLKVEATLKENSGKKLNVKQIGVLSGLADVLSGDAIANIVDDLVKEGKVEVLEPYQYRFVPDSTEMSGRYEFNRDEGAFVVIEATGEHILLLPNQKVRAFPGDTISVSVILSGKNKGMAEFLDVLERKRTKFIGTIDNTGFGNFFIPQDTKIKTDFYIQGNLNGAKPGDKVLVEITKWNRDLPDCIILEVLGAGGVHAVEMNAIIMEYGLPTAFPASIEADAEAIKKIGITPKDVAKRRDFRKTLTFTIDPFDAKDFDDALSFKVLDNGNYEVGVHIADVTHYLQEGSLLDLEAQDRATSIYLVDRTIPMLPEVLSNDLCSLKPNEDRLTFSAVFTINEAGEILETWLGRTIIHSQRRFTYEEVQFILETGTGEHAPELLILNRLAYKLRKDRFAQGSINFETEEVKFKLDDSGKPIEVYRKVRKDAHKLIEDFMLLANRAVAQFVAGYRKDPQIPFVYRVHAVPEGEKLRNLKNFVKQFGYTIETDDERTVARSLNKMVIEAEGKPEQNIIQTVAIRSMPKAVYTTKNIGHYGLGFEYYTHFTSPIRRYPDVIAHRILDAVLKKKLDSIKPVESLEQQCRHCSEREKRAADAERASIKYKQVEYLGAAVGETFVGMVSGVTDWGIYVELEENKCEGLISWRDVRDDMYDVDASKFIAKGRFTGNTFRLGDVLVVKVKKTNLLKRTIDFILVRRGGLDSTSK